jgi:uncharacterized protein (TIGR03067 family)
MRIYFDAVVMALALLGAGCAPTASTSSITTGSVKVIADPLEYDRLKGTWHVVAIEAAGKPVRNERVQELDLRYIFEGSELTIRGSNRPDKASSFVVDSQTSPKQMTINQRPVVRAVYSLEDKRLRLCVMVDENPNAGFPTELVSRASPKTDVLTLERR